jgi:hypothetical protein
LLLQEEVEVAEHLQHLITFQVEVELVVLK